MPRRMRRSSRSRAVRRRGRRMRRTTAQHYFRHKMTQIIPIQSRDNTGVIRKCLSLQNTGQTPVDDATSIYGFDGTTRWPVTYRNYEAYAVKGLKVKWIPTNARGGVS